MSENGSWKKKLALFLSSQTVSMFGSSLVQYAIVWSITLDTRSGVMMTLAVVFGFVPMFVVSPFAGVWADRHDRKKLIMLSDGLIAAATLAAALLVMAGFRSVWLLLGTSAVRAFGQAVQGPAVGAILPQFVPEEKLMRANAVNGTIQSAVMLVSPMIAGALLSLAPLEAIFFIDVATAAAAIGILLALRVPPHAKALESVRSGYFRDMALGLRYIREHRYLVTFFVYLGLLLVMISPSAFLTPLQTTRTFGAEVWRLTAIEIAFSVGMIAGGALASIWGGFRNRMRTLVLSNLIMASCALGLAVVPSFPVYVAVMAVFGVAMPFWNAPSSTMIQEHVEPEFLGRVFSVMGMLSTSLMPLGMLVFGPLADLVSVESLLLVTGAFMLVHGLAALANRRLMEAGVPVAPPLEPTAAIPAGAE